MPTTRENIILNLIVDDYIKGGTPIASESLVRNHGLSVSSATIRNDVAELEQGGYITRPYTSAGSVPLDKGYRVYVETLASTEVNRILPSLKETIRRQLIEVERDIDAWTSVAAAALARLVGNMAIATFPKAREARVRHVELVGMQDLLVLLIVVFEQVRLRRQLIRLENPVGRSDLEAVSNRVNEMVQGLSRQEIETKQMSLSPLEGELVDTTVLMLKDEDTASSHDHFLDGLANLLAQPEFAEMEKMRAVVEGVEDGSLAQAILDEAPETGTVRVVIGHENRGVALWPLSIVISQYGIPGEAAGTVAAVGPMRMEYSRAIAGVELMALSMSDMVENVHGL